MQKTYSLHIIGALIIQAHDKPILTLPQQPQSLTNAIASSAHSEQKTAKQNAVNRFDNINSYPNPFISNFTVSFRLPKADDVQVEIYNVNEQAVYQKRFENLVAGNNSLQTIPQNILPSGVYLVKLTHQKLQKAVSFKLIKQ